MWTCPVRYIFWPPAETITSIQQQGGGRPAGKTCFRGVDCGSELTLLFGLFLSFHSQLFVLFQAALKRRSINRFAYVERIKNNI